MRSRLIQADLHIQLLPLSLSIKKFLCLEEIVFEELPSLLSFSILQSCLTNDTTYPILSQSLKNLKPIPEICTLLFAFLKQLQGSITSRWPI